MRSLPENDLEVLTVDAGPHHVSVTQSFGQHHAAPMDSEANDEMVTVPFQVNLAAIKSRHGQPQ
jgi:hypothetical protein